MRTGRRPEARAIQPGAPSAIRARDNDDGRLLAKGEPQHFALDGRVKAAGENDIVSAGERRHPFQHAQEDLPGALRRAEKRQLRPRPKGVWTRNAGCTS